MSANIFDEIYERLPLEKVPWNLSETPELLTRLIEEGTIAPCKAAEFGCGAGRLCHFLARATTEVLR